MIKLIATDIDGTLLKEGTDQINPEMYEVIVKLKQQGVIFAAASVRTYSSLRRLFDPVANDMIFIAENGANVICRNYQMDYTLLNRKDAEDLAFYIRKLPGCCLRVQFVPSGTASHSMEYIQAGKTEAAHNCVIYGAKALAGTAWDLIADPALIPQIEEEFARNRKEFG